jgi:hypothetical protein
MHGLLTLYVELIVLVALAAALIFRGFGPVGLFDPVYLFGALLSADRSAKSGPR